MNRTSFDWKNADPAFRNMFQLVNGLIAWTTITPLYYQGRVAGTEYLTYNAGKLYVALELSFHTGNNVLGDGGISVLYDMANAENLHLNQTSTMVYWSGAAAVYRYGTQDEFVKNVWFSRCVPEANKVYIRFNGYRLNV